MNRMTWHRIGMIAAGVLGTASAAQAADRRVELTGCNCRGNASAVMAPVDSSPMMSTPTMESAPMMSGGMVVGSPVVTAPVMKANLPPGTLGQTYLRPSAPVPAAKHPRAGLIDVYAPGATSVSVQWTHPYRLTDELEGFVDVKDKDIFHFEEKQMLPGVPYIVRVEARYGTEDKPRYEERYARLVMGRIVSVSFDEPK